VSECIKTNGHKGPERCGSSFVGHKKKREIENENHLTNKSVLMTLLWCSLSLHR
jgi:hypothetical protein